MSSFSHYFLPHHSNNQRARILHPSFTGLIILAFSLFQLLLTQFSRDFPLVLGHASTIPPAEVIRLTNVERRNHGLPELVANNQLSQAAAQKAGDMFARDYWAHVSPGGTQPWFFITESGYSYRYAGENLARDFSDPDSVVRAWMNSPTHKDNVLSNRYQDIGVAVVDGKLNGRETTLVVQMFGSPISAPPVVDSGSSFTVKAQEAPAPAVVASAPPTSDLKLTGQEFSPVSSLSIGAAPVQASLFRVNKYTSFVLLFVLAAVLLLDVILINRRRITRWTSKGLAHFIFISILLAAVALVMRGRII